MEVMRQALVQLAKEIEELKFKYIEAERSSNVDNMEAILNELDVLEAYYNHQAAIVNGDASSNLSQEDQFLRSIQNSTFDNPSSDVHSTDVTFQSRWMKLHDALKQQKKSDTSRMGFCYICLCDVAEDDLILFSCGHSVCVGECGVRLPSPFCPAPTCNNSIEDVLIKFETDAGCKKRKAEEVEKVANPPVVPVALSSPDIIVIDDDECDNDDDEDVVFLESRKP